MKAWTKDEFIVLPIMLVVLFALSVLLGILLKGKSEKVRSIPLIIIASIILIMELVKQIVALANHTYTGWTVPLHFCSFFMVWFPLAQFTKGKLKQVGMACSLMTSMLMFALFYVSPRSIIGSSCSNVFESFSSFHTFTFHHLVILYLFCFLSLRVYKPQKSDFLWSSLCLTGYYVLGVSMAHILNVNYTNFLFSTISFIESIRLKVGQVAYTILLYLAGLSGANFILFVYYLIYNKIKKKQKIEI